MQNTFSVENGHGRMSQIEWRMHCNWMLNTFSVENCHGCMSQIEWRMHCSGVQNTSTGENGHGCMSQIEGGCIEYGSRKILGTRMVMAGRAKLSGVYIAN